MLVSVMRLIFFLNSKPTTAKKKEKKFDPFEETKSYASHHKVNKHKEGKVSPLKKAELRANPSSEQVENASFVISVSYIMFYVIL